MEPKTISPDEASMMLDEGRVTFVDARNSEAWAESKQRLPGALRIPADEVDHHLGELPKQGTIVAYCT